MREHGQKISLIQVSAFGISAMALIVVASNVLVQFLYGDWLTYGAFVYPFAFLVTDVINRVAGPARARRVVLAGFCIGIVCSLAGSMIENEFGPLVTFRIAIGSGTAFLVAQLLDVTLFDMLRKGRWWRAPLVSTVVGSVVDTALFFGIAFSAAFTFLEPANDVSWANEGVPVLGIGPVAPFWISLAVADLFVKLTISLIALIPFRLATVRLMRRASWTT